MRISYWSSDVCSSDLLRVATGGRHNHSAKEKPPPFPVRVDQDKAPGGDLLRVATCGRHNQSAKEKPPPFPVRVDQDKAPGGDLLLHGKATLPSAHARFTSEFGMGSGGTTPLWPPGKGWEQRGCAGSTSS